MRIRPPSGIRRILVLARAEVLHVVRDRATLVQVILMPLVQLLVLSNVATFAVRSTPAYVVDFDRTSTSRGIVSRLRGSQLFEVVGQSASPDSADHAMLSGAATLVLTIPHGFEASLVRDDTAPVSIQVNAVKGAAAGIVQSYVGRIVADYANDLTPRLHPNRMTVSAADEPPPHAGVPRLDIRTRGWYNPELDYRQYMVPGILVALVTMIGTLLTAQNIAREKEIGTIEQLNVTPITKTQFIVAKLLPFWTLALVDLALGMVVARTLLHVPMRGSPLLLFACAAVYLVVALGIGLWVSTIVETQQQAMFVTFFLMMIYLLMSGLFTPIDSMPPWMQTLSLFNPVRHFVTVSRGILIRGAGVAEVLRPMAILAAFGAVVLTLAVRQYRKTSS